MPQSFSNVALHIIFSTKSHAPHLADRELRTQLHAYLAGTCNAIGCPAIIIGGFIDHVHILCFLSRTKSISDLIKDLKIESSKWLKTKGPTLKEFSWQSGYAAYSVSDSLKDMVFEYILNQEEHHRRKTFREEYMKYLMENNIQFDERYVWD